MKWNRKNLVDACYREFTRPETTLKLVVINGLEDARCNFHESSPHRMEIFVDPNRTGLIQAVLHESLHVVLNEDLKPFGWRLEEDIIRKFEDTLWKLCFKKRETIKWRNAITRKLKECDE